MYDERETKSKPIATHQSSFEYGRRGKTNRRDISLSERHLASRALPRSVGESICDAFLAEEVRTAIDDDGFEAEIAR